MDGRHGSWKALNMSLTDLHIDQSAFNEAYSKADASLRVRQSKLYLILTLVLVPAYVGLDYVVYPSLWHQIFIGRLLCDVAQLPCVALLYTSWGKRHVVLLSKYPPLAPCVTICWMIYASEGVISPYYAGINLVLVGVCLLIPYTLGEAGLISGFVQAGKNEHYELTVEVKGNASGVGDTVKFPLSVAR